MNERLDFRIQRTYKLLTKSLFELLEEKEFKSITVGELCERAMIRRATFYKHFSDKYEFFAFAVRETLDLFSAEVKLEYDVENPESFYIKLMELAVRFSDENRSLVNTIFNSATPQMLDILYDELEARILLHLRAGEAAGSTFPARVELLAVLISGAIVFTIKRKLIDGFEFDLSEFTELCNRLSN